MEWRPSQCFNILPVEHSNAAKNILKRDTLQIITDCTIILFLINPCSEKMLETTFVMNISFNFFRLMTSWRDKDEREIIRCEVRGELSKSFLIREIIQKCLSSASSDKSKGIIIETVNKYIHQREMKSLRAFKLFVCIYIFNTICISERLRQGFRY